MELPQSKTGRFFEALDDRVFLAGLVFVPFAVRLWLAAAIPLTEDEAYYRLWALSPAASYLDHPPMVGWMMAGGMMLAGDTAVGLRLGGLVAAAVSVLALWRIAVLVTDVATARLAVLFASVIPLLSVGVIIMTPDTPSVLFYTLGAWALAELTASRNASWWIAVGACAGLGLLSKYTNFFFGLSICVWLLMTRRNWHWFGCWQLYAGGALALVLFSPVIWWNVLYEGASFAKQFGRVADVDGFKIVWSLEMWGALILLLGPVLFWLAIKGAIYAGQRTWGTGDISSALLIALTAPLIVYFSVHALHGRVLPNWLAPAYPFFALLAATGASAIKDKRAKRRAVVWGGLVSAGLTILIHAHAVRPFYVSASLKEPTHQLRGWPEFAEQIERHALAVGASYIGAVSYGTTAHLASILDRRMSVVQINDRLRYVHLPAPAARLLREVGVVVDLSRRRPGDLLKRYFGDVVSLGTISRSWDDEALQTYDVFIVTKPLCDWRKYPSACPD